MHAVAWICNFVGHSHRFSNLCWWVRPRVNIRHPRTLPGGSQGCADRILEQTVLHTYPQQLAGSGLRRYRSERVHTPHRHRRPAATPSGMAPSIDHVQRGAGHTVIEARYTRMANGRQAMRLFNHLATAATLIYLTAQLRSRDSKATDTAQLTTQELLLGFTEISTWMLFLIGLGYGRVSREREWLLRVSLLMAAGSMGAMVINLNPGRLHEAADILANKDSPGYNLQALGILGQLVALGCRIACLKTGTEFVKEKRATGAGKPPAQSEKRTK